MHRCMHGFLKYSGATGWATGSAAGTALIARGAGARAAAAARSTVATEGQRATPAAQPTAARTGK